MSSTLIEEKDKDQFLYLDDGYESKDDEGKKCGLISAICEKSHRNNPLTDEQKQYNRLKSMIKCWVKHIFGFIEGSMNGSFVRSFSIVLTKAATVFISYVYNSDMYKSIAAAHRLLRDN